MWSVPTVASFSGKYNDADPSFSPDGKRIYFMSYRTKQKEQSAKFEVWYVQKQDDGSWGEAQRVEAVATLAGYKSYPSVTRDGSLYFSLIEEGKSNVYVSRLKHGIHQQPIKTNIKSSSVAISPDESFIVLQEAGNLMISYQTNGEWGKVIKLPSPINSKFSESSPNISADGKRLLFTSNRLDYSNSAKPRRINVSTFSDVKHELTREIKNKLRNIYQVTINHTLFISGKP